MFESYRKLQEFERQYSSTETLPVEKKLALLDGMLRQAQLMRPEIYADAHYGLEQKVAFVKILHSVRGTSR